jgi:putative ATPase
VLRPGQPPASAHRGQRRRAGPISAILWGPPGTGKTTLAHLVASAAGREFVELSAVTAGVKDVRAVMEAAARNRDLYDRQTVLFLDEIHRFTKAQQDALLPGVENRQVILVAATTENPSFSVIAPLLSRSVLITLTSLSDEGHSRGDRCGGDGAGGLAAAYTWRRRRASTWCGSAVVTPGAR